MEGCCWRLVGGGVCQLFDFPAFRLVDLLGSWKVGELAGCGGFLVYRRGKRASAAVVWLVCRWVVAGQQAGAGGGLPAGGGSRIQGAVTGLCSD